MRRTSLRRSDTPPRGRQPGNARPASSDTPLTGAAQEQGPSPSTLGSAGLRRPFRSVSHPPIFCPIFEGIVIAALARPLGGSPSAWAVLPGASLASPRSPLRSCPTLP